MAATHERRRIHRRGDFMAQSNQSGIIDKTALPFVIDKDCLVPKEPNGSKCGAQWSG